MTMYSREIQGLMNPYPVNPFAKREQKEKIMYKLKEIEKRIQKIEKLLQAR